MQPSEAFKHLRTLAKAALESDNIVLVHEQIKMMMVVIEKASPPPAEFQKQVGEPKRR